MTLSDTDHAFLVRCVDLAEVAVDRGDEAFGSVLVLDGDIRHEDANAIHTTNDATRHPEIELARWAAAHLTPTERARAVVYTSGEHCSMCASAHAWVGLGPIVYASSTAQLLEWFDDFGVSNPSPIKPLAISDVTATIQTCGPDPRLAERIKDLHRRVIQR